MKILFLGYAVDPEIADGLSGVSVAGNKMQVNVLKGLSSYSDVELKCITVYPVAAFPREKKLWIKGNMIKVAENVNSYRVPFLNLPIIKQFWQIFSVWNTAKKLSDRDTLIFSFNLFPQVGIPFMKLKKKYNCKTCSLLADLPIDDNNRSKNPVRNYLRKIFDKATLRAIQACDSFIPLNRYAVEKYAYGKPFEVVEGGFDILNIQKPDFIRKKRKNIIYSGALTEYSGVLNLIEAMKYVKDSEAVLEIYGKGYLCDEIKEIQKKQTNVRYIGSVTNKEMISIQQDAFLLVNPRPVEDEIAKVTFPSKIFEYMTSGTPVLSTKLNGITKEYYPFLFLSEDNSPINLAKGIDEVLNCSYEFLSQKAKSAYEFIKSEKNWKVQNGKIYNFLLRQKNNE